MIWDNILRIKRQMVTDSDWPECLSLYADEVGSVNWFADDKADITVRFNGSSASCFSADLFTLDIPPKSRFTHKDVALLRLYLPYTLLSLEASQRGRSVAISHFAQTLDGRIASGSGDSKWIGNEQNLIHAHRMRALCDAILIGARTLAIDNPRLSVRKVQGPSPVKVIVGGDRLTLDDYRAIDEDTILVCRNVEDTEHANSIALGECDVYRTKTILEALYARGLHSVYIEGGALTTSQFLTQQTLDQIQLHISPQILGSGTTSFSFPGINDMSGAIKFKQGRFVNIGDEVMFIGNL